MGKRQTTINIDEVIIEKAKLMGVNMSQVASLALAHVLNTGTFQPLQVELTLVNMRIKDLEDLKTSYMTRSKELGVEIARLQSIKSRILLLIQEAEKDTEIAKLFQELLDICKAREFDESKAWNDSEDIREKLNAFGIEYDYVSFSLYVRTMERGMK